MNNETNFIKFAQDTIETSKGTGTISTLTTDIDITAVPFESNNENAPTHQVYAKSPRGKDIPVGGIWKKENQAGGSYFTISIKDIKFNANLGKFPGQDDLSLQAIIKWEPQQEQAAA